MTATESGLGLKADFGILPFQVLSADHVDSGGQKGGSVVVMQEPTPQDLNRGFIEQLNAVELKIVSNIAWVLLVSTDNNNLGTSDDGTYIKPIDDFQLRAGVGPYISLSQKSQKLMEGSPGVLIPSIDYKLLTDSDTFHPGNYKVEVIYMITSL